MTKKRKAKRFAKRDQVPTTVEEVEAAAKLAVMAFGLFGQILNGTLPRKPVIGGRSTKQDPKAVENIQDIDAEIISSKIKNNDTGK